MCEKKTHHVPFVSCRLVAQLRDMEMAFDGFFEKHHLKLQQYLQLLQYEISFHEVQTSVELLKVATVHCFSSFSSNKLLFPKYLRMAHCNIAVFSVIVLHMLLCTKPDKVKTISALSLLFWLVLLSQIYFSNLVHLLSI